MKKILMIGTYLLLLVTISGNFLFVSIETNNFIIFTLSLILILLLLPKNAIKIKMKQLSLLALSALLVIVISLAILPLNFKHSIFLGILLFAISRLLKNSAFYEKEIILIFIATLFFYLIFLLIYSFMPPIWLSVQMFSKFLTKNMASLIAEKALFGATAIGLPVTVLFIIFILMYHIHSKARSKKLLILGLISILIAQALSILMQILMVNFLKKLNASIFVTPMDFIFILFIFGMIPIYFFTNKAKLKCADAQSKLVISKYYITGLIFLFVSLILLTLQDIPLPSHTKKTVFLYSKGVVNWNKPEFGKYGLRSSGMFGMLPEYLRTFNYTVVQDFLINPSSLKDAKVLVIINLDKNFSHDEKKAIQDFVKAGGSLLVLGDHTGLGGIMAPLNDLLKFVGIEYNFDSAHYLKEDWGHSLEFLSHPITRKLKSNVDVGISVGASLNLRNLNAFPIITAKFGFSDWGNALNKSNAFLGDRRYNEGELLGDIILVAQANYGKGKVLVFGDTSSFQNGVLERNFKFIDRIFNYLTDLHVLSISIIKYAGFILLLFSMVIILKSYHLFFQQSKAIYLLGVVFLALVMTNFIMIDHKHDNFPNGNIAYVDWSHLDRFDIYGEDGVWSFSYNLMRNGYLPFIHREFSEQALNESKLFVVIAPARSFSKSELKAIDNYIKNGGIIYWSVGHEEKEASLTFLKKYGLDIDNVPLGSVPKEQTNQGIRFVEAWPIILDDKNNAQVLCTAWEFPTIVSKKIEQGKLILIADSYFFLSRNLEQDQTYYEENILFLKSLLEK